MSDSDERDTLDDDGAGDDAPGMWVILPLAIRVFDAHACARTTRPVLMSYPLNWYPSPFPVDRYHREQALQSMLATLQSC